MFLKNCNTVINAVGYNTNDTTVLHPELAETKAMLQLDITSRHAINSPCADFV